jgi:ribonuclease P protein component
VQRTFRLRRSADFEHVRTQGRTWRHPFLTLGIVPNTLGSNRFGFVTGRRLGNAVTRNRVRRLLREAVRSFLPRLKPGYDVALIARNEIVGQAYNSVKSTVGELFVRAHLMEEQDL